MGPFSDGDGRGKMKQDLRYCVAGWNAFPVFWYMTIEYDMAFYGDDEGYDEQKNIREWMEVGKYFRAIDPMQRSVSLRTRTTRASYRINLEEPDLIDFDSLQLGSCDSITIKEMARVLPKALKTEPRLAVLAADQCCEGLNEANWANIQLHAFGAAILPGSSGYTYGANGIWQFNDNPYHFEPAPSGIAWGGPGWREAMVFPGAEQIARSKQVLERYESHRIEPHPVWFIDQGCGPPAFAGGISGGARFFYLTFGHHRRGSL